MFIDEVDRSAPLALALGTFDGVHLGHRAVLSLARENACGLRPAALFFTPHPRTVLCGAAPGLILTEAQREAALRAEGMQEIIRVDFKAVQALSPEVFFHRLTDALPIGMLCCGYNFRFGNRGAGDTETLSALCRADGIRFAAAEKVELDGAPVSSSRIRTCIEQGDIPEAERLLGRPLIYSLRVENGDHRGRTIGFPTINQLLPPELARPRFGVYVSEVLLKGKWYRAVTNIGIRPTYQIAHPQFETFIVGFQGDLYGEEISLRLRQFTRPETRFSSLEALKTAIESDLAAALAFEE